MLAVVRKFEVRGVWYFASRAESYPRRELEARTADFGRPPNAIGIYERHDDGTLSHITDEPDVQRAEEFLGAFMSTWNLLARSDASTAR